MLSKNDILSINDDKIKVIKVPEWNGEVGVKVMSGSDRDRWEIEYASSTDPNRSVRSALLAFCLCDEKGNRIFDESDIKALGAKSGAALDRCFAVAIKVNRITKDEIEELEKN